MAWLQVQYLAVTGCLSGVKSATLPDGNPSQCVVNTLVSKKKKKKEEPHQIPYSNAFKKHN